MIKKTTKEKLEDKIRVLSETVWKDKVDGGLLDSWLSNFVNSDIDLQETERMNALYLLSKFMYFGNRETREMLKTIYRDKFKYRIIKSIRQRNSNTSDIKFIEGEFTKALSETRFLGVGNPSESGIHLLYYFRQENKLSKECFIHTHEIFDFTSSPIKLKSPSVKRYIFIDDFCGSGSQAIQYSKDIVDHIKKINPDAEVYYYPLFATEKALGNLKSYTNFDEINPVFSLDETFKCFSDLSRFYPPPLDYDTRIKKDSMHVICNTYGKSLFNPPLGFDNGQLAIGFFHNTPDNTLPVFWSDMKNWSPFFKRYHKIY